MQRPDPQAYSDGKVARLQVFAFAPVMMEDLLMPCLQLKTGESMLEAGILQSLSDSDVVAVYFEKFSDGRGFSLERQLRCSLSHDHPLVAMVTSSLIRPIICVGLAFRTQ